MKTNELLITYSYLIVTIIVSLTLNLGCGKDKGGQPTVAPVATIPPPASPPPPSVSNPLTNYTFLSWGGDIRVIDNEMYERFLSDHNICDYPGMIWGFGTWDCNNYRALYVSLQLQGSSVPTQGIAQLWHYTNYNWYSIYQTILNGEFAAIDNNTGIEIYRRGYDGTATYNAIFRYRAYGPLTKDQPLEMELWYRQVKFATARVYPN